MPPILGKETGTEDIPPWRQKAWPQLGVACPEDISVLESHRAPRCLCQTL